MTRPVPRPSSLPSQPQELAAPVPFQERVHGAPGGPRAPGGSVEPSGRSSGSHEPGEPHEPGESGEPGEPGEPGESSPGLNLSPTQIAAGALAAVTSAVAASFFGVAGTLIGAALGSVVSTVGAAVYSASLSRAAARSAAVTRTLVVRPGDEDTSRRGPVAGRSAPADAVRGSSVIPSRTGPGAAGAERGFSWKPLALLASLAFGIAVAFLTLTEAALGHPVSDSTGSGTSVGRLVGGDPVAEPQPGSSEPVAPPSPSVSPSQAPSVTSSPSGVPSEALTPTPSQPTPSQPAPATPTPSEATNGPQASPTGGTGPGAPTSPGGSASAAPTPPAPSGAGG